MSMMNDQFAEQVAHDRTMATDGLVAPAANPLMRLVAAVIAVAVLGLLVWMLFFASSDGDAGAPVGEAPAGQVGEPGAGGVGR